MYILDLFLKIRILVRLYDVIFMRTQNQNEFKIHQGYKTGRINY